MGGGESSRLETGQEMADFIVSQMSVPLPAITAERVDHVEAGVSVQKWTETSGTPLMYNGQGKYEGKQPYDRSGQRIESYRVGGGSTDGAERPLQEPTSCAKLLEFKQPPAAPGSQVSVATTSTAAELCQHTSHTPLAPQSNTAGRQPPSIAAEDVLQPLGHSTAVSDDKKGCTSLCHASEHSGLNPPILMSGERVGGHNKKRLRAENKQKRVHRQLAQDKPSYWTLQEGNFKEPTAVAELDDYIGEMCPKGLALHHPAAAKLLQYATGGCPVNSGQPWTTEMIEAAIARGPHVSALVPEAIAQLESEAREKEKRGQCRIVEYEQLKRDGIPPQLKISPIAMIPHKSRKFRAI